MSYRIEYYFPDGCEGPNEDRKAPHGAITDTMKQAQDLIKRINPGVDARDVWYPRDADVGYHESNATGCGGWTISKID